MLESRTQGFTLIELLVVMAIIGILLGIGVYSFLSARNPARETALSVHSALFKLRAEAMANTQARRMVLNASGQLVLQSALNCGDSTQANWTSLGTVERPEPSNRRPVTLTNVPPTAPVSGQPDVVVCFTPRGSAAAQGELRIYDTRATFAIRVALAGGVNTGGL